MTTFLPFLLALTLLLQTRQLVTACDSRLLCSAILALAAARPELAQQGTPSPSSSSLSPSSRSPSRSPCRHLTSPSRHPAAPEAAEGSKKKRSSFQADLHEDEWVRRQFIGLFDVCFHVYFLCYLHW